MLSPMSRFGGPVRTAVNALREAMANNGIRRLELAWMIGIGADMALTVILLVVVYGRGGVVAAGLLGAVRMVPAVVSAMLAGSIVERFRGDRILATIGLARAASAALIAVVIAAGGPLPVLFALAAIVAAAGAPVRPIQATLMPAVARSPRELVAANTAWSSGEGIGSLIGPALAGLFVAVGVPALGAGLTALAFLGTAVVIVGLRFEQAADATGGGGRRRGRRSPRRAAPGHARSGRSAG